ncbi:hypothetical protein C0J52_20688 [Blattella germanica]|nr:hypothetical protein C0J52_20688 [Blattella germanica]
MYGRPVISQEWSVHAQLTISHSRPNENSAAQDVPAATATSAEHQDSGDVRMEYSWGGQPSSPQPPTSSSTNIPPRTCYGFQRGNILFTTRPPPREAQIPKPSHQPGSAPSQTRTTNLLDSGYSSEQISPGSYASLPTRRPAQPYSRRCKSTCSIVLSGSENQGVASASMRPNIEVGCMGDPEDSVCYPSGYKCGDPLCYHQNTPIHQHGRPKSSDFAPLPETCEVCGGGRSPTAIRRASGTNTFTTHFCTRVPDRVTRENQDVDPLIMIKPSKDASSQTSDHLVTSTTPAVDENSLLNKNKPTQPKMGNKSYGGFRRKTDSDLLQIPMINVPEADTEMKKTSSGKRLSRSPAHRLSRSPARLQGQSPLAGWKSRGSQCTTMPTDSSDVKGQRKPRTVHIDVYCTGSEDADASGSSDSSDEMSDSWSSPQTVFESEKVKVVHSRMGKERLPVGFLRRQEQQQRQQQVSNLISRRSESFKHESNRDAQQQQQVMRAYDSDDGLSSQYPSQASSYSTLRAATESSMPQSEVATTTSRGPSWSTISTSSMALSDEYDSAAATSWKDTATDMESLVHSAVSLAQSDSFEYADAADRLRIKEKERAWAGTEGKDDSSKTWRSPHLERKHFLQQQKFKEFLEKHLGKSSLPLWKPETTEDSDDDDETGDAWSFCGRDTDSSPKPPGSTLKREDTVKRVTSAKDKAEVHTTLPKNPEKSSTFLRPPSRETGSLSDSGPHRYIRRTVIGPFGSKSPSPPPLKVASSVTSPFTTSPGKRTDQLSKAEKFGTIVGAFRKPGHHVGPSKNPECKCEHCRRYYEEIGYRTRTRSVGDMPIDNTSENWQTSLNILRSKNGVEDSQGLGSNVGATTLESDLESSITEDASTDNERFVRQHMSSVMGSEEEDNGE